MGYCYFGRCECSLLMENGSCVNDTIDKCIHPAAVEDYKSAYEYIEYEPPKPNPDLVAVTRCKDCKHNPKLEWFGCPMASLSEKQRPETAWCWKGERKDGNDHG